MSGPVDGVSTGTDAPEAPVVEVTESRTATVGEVTVRRALPRRGRRTVGAWCFADHMGPADVDGPGIGPHPHTGLHTVTWLVEGEALHRDSLGSEQLVRPGQLNLMTAGNGVVARRGVHRRGVAAAARRAALGRAAGGHAGRRGGVRAPRHAAGRRGGPAASPPSSSANCSAQRPPARQDTPLFGADLALHGLVDLAAGPDVRVRPRRARRAPSASRASRRHARPDRVPRPGPRRGRARRGRPGAGAAARWGAVRRGRRHVVELRRPQPRRDDRGVAVVDGGDDRFGTVASGLPRIPVGPPPWLPAGA